MKRRVFLKEVGIVSTSLLVIPRFTLFENDDNSNQINKWLSMMKDPVYDLIEGEPNLEQILKLFPRPQGIPAFDPLEIQENVSKIKTVPVVDTGYPYLDLSIKVGLAHIDATFEGKHPKYGAWPDDIHSYYKMMHDGFPPIIISAVDALSKWGLNERAVELFHYWITNFINEGGWPREGARDGTINYYGPSIAEYGQILHTATILYERAGEKNWWNDCFHKINLLAEYLLNLHSEALKNEDGLISGTPEADTRGDKGKYFHNNAWVVKGLHQWVKLCTIAKVTPSTSLNDVVKSADRLKEDTLKAINKKWPSDKNAWWLPALSESKINPKNLTDIREASYTNYRYWPELLSSDILPDEMANRVVNARLNGGGQFCGMTRFRDWLDDWPLYDYLYALWNLGRKNDFLLSLFGHIAYHQCEGHMTAYEQFRFPGDSQGSRKAGYCLPSQLVAARAGRFINKQ
ncbi:MAG: hypothetical protein ACOX19_08620 [Fermentimonas sp.]